MGRPSKYQRVSRLGFVTAPISLNGGQPNFARCLAVSWAGTLYIHFRASCPLTEFCQLQNSTCFQVLRSPVLAALLHGSRAVGVSQTLRRSAEGQKAPLIFGRAAITLGIGRRSSLCCFCKLCFQKNAQFVQIVKFINVHELLRTCNVRLARANDRVSNANNSALLRSGATELRRELHGLPIHQRA